MHCLETFNSFPPFSNVKLECYFKYVGLLQVMENLMKIPSDYWSSFVNVVETQRPSSQLRQTPSTDSLLASSGRRGFFTPNSR